MSSDVTAGIFERNKNKPFMKGTN